MVTSLNLGEEDLASFDMATQNDLANVPRETFVAKKLPRLPGSKRIDVHQLRLPFGDY